MANKNVINDLQWGVKAKYELPIMGSTLSLREKQRIIWFNNSNIIGELMIFYDLLEYEKHCEVRKLIDDEW